MATNKTISALSAAGPLQYSDVFPVVRSGQTLKGSLSELLSSASSGQFNVVHYGAAGDGTTDDYAAILAARDALIEAGAGVIYFPGNKTYRVATAGVHGLHLNGVSNVEVEMGPGAKLVMDNMVDGDAVSHGIFVQGPCENVTLRGCHVEYAAFSENRQTWSPIFFIGANVSATGTGAGAWFRGAADDERPDLIEEGACRNVRVIDCVTKNSPSVMLGLVGIDGGLVENFHGDSSHADGIYQLYFRNTVINGARLTNVGDDAVSFSSYESEVTSASIENAFHGEGSVADGITIDSYYPTPGVNPSGAIALLGVRNLAVSNVTIRNKFRGIRVECGTALSTAYPFLSTLANRGVQISGVSIENAFHSIACINKEVGFSSDSKWWKNDVSISGVISIRTTSSPWDTNLPFNSYGDAQDTGDTIPAIMSGFRFQDCHFYGASATGGLQGVHECVFDGITMDQGFAVSGYVPYRGDLTDTSYPDNNCDFLNISAPSFTLVGLKKCWIDGCKSENAPAVGFGVYCCADLAFGTITVKNTNRDNDMSPGGLVIDELSLRISGDLFVFDQDDVSLPDALSINSAADHFVKKAVVKTGLNTFYRMVFDRRFQNDGVSQVGAIHWYHSANGFPKWNTLEYSANQIGIAGNANFDVYPETSARIYRIGFALTTDRTCTVHEGGAGIGDVIEVLRNNDSTGVAKFSVYGQGDATPAVSAAPARGTFMVTGGSYSPGVNQIVEVRVNGVNILPAPIDWGSPDFFDNNNEDTAYAIAQAIHTAGGTYDAESSLNLVAITAPNGAAYNGYALTFVTSGDVVISHVHHLSGGLNAASAGSTPSPYLLTELLIPGTGCRLVFNGSAWELLSRTSLQDIFEATE